MSNKPDSVTSKAKNLIRRLKDGASAQQIWRDRVCAHAAAINAFVATGLDVGWENVGDEPAQPDVDYLVDVALDAVRQANERGDTDKLREQWPPTYGPLIPILEANGQSIPIVCLLDDGSVVARIGGPYEAGKTIQISGDTVTDVPGVDFFGRCPRRRYFAYERSEGVEITDGWLGPRVVLCPWPTGLEDIPEGFRVPKLSKRPIPTQLIPFPDGRRVLLVSGDGIFVLSEVSARRLLPTKSDMKEHFEWSQKEHPNDPLSLELSMEHGAVSGSGDLIAVGSQDSDHLVFNANLEPVADVGTMSEYPHYAVFSADDSVIAVNSCHFYNGITIGIPTDLLPGLDTDAYEEDSRVPILEDIARVYAGVCRGDEFIIGDAGGYVRAFSTTGEYRWQFFIGSSVGSIDLSPDERTLVVSTYAGYISLIQLDAGLQPPHQIGNGGHVEYRRWLFWKNEPKPLIW